MVQEIHLFIDKKEVFFSEPPEILFTFQRVDYTNPSIIKNNFTKTIEIEGTPENNKVFGEIWKLDRTHAEGLFNPSKRVPFELFSNGDLLETGYAKLDNIARNGNAVVYEITLYGGLGDFFYGLSYGFDYDTERKVTEADEQAKDEELKLCDLTYVSETEDDSTEFNFNITKDAVHEAWQRLGNTTTTPSKWDCINFAPAYNGLPDDFDADKVLINSNGYTTGCRLSVPAGATVDGTHYTTQQVITSSTIPTAIMIDDKTYTQQNGYAMAELRENLTEWEARDLRSYLQRPVLRVKALFNAIKRYAKTKGEYDLILDEDFFNNDNPYYNDAWITLPMLQNLNGEYAEQETTGALGIGTPKSMQTVDDGFYNSFYHKKQIAKYDVIGLPASLAYKGASIAFSLGVNATQNTGMQSMSCELSTSKYKYASGGYDNMTLYLSNFDVQLIAYDDSDNVVGRSKHHCFTSNSNGMVYDGRWNYYGLTEADVHVGVFKNSTGATGTGDFYFETTGYTADQFNIELENLEKEYSRLELVITKYIQYTDKFKNVVTSSNNFYTTLIDSYKQDTQGVTYYNCWGVNEFRNAIKDSSVIYRPDNDTMKSYQLITKKKLLSQDGTPAKYMIDYCKLFNLYFDKDPVDKTVTIRTRHNFYNDDVINLEQNIDRSKEITVKPIAFDTKWYDFNFTEEDQSESAKKYKNTWGTDYGKQKVNTGFNFDNSSTNLLDGNIYTNGLDALEKSKYFINKKKERLSVPSYLFEWSTFKLFNITEASVESQDETYIGQPPITSSSNMNEAGQRYDMFTKLQLHSESNSPIDGSNMLVFYNGKKETKDANGGPISYYITDDNAAMLSLNGEQTCWLYTNSTTDISGNEIAKLLTVQRSGRTAVPVLPTFNRFEIIEGKYISATWDFGKVNELFVPYASYLDYNRPTIYGRFWDDYIADLYSVNTRIVNCYVKLDGKVEGDWLKSFYYFDNSIWCLTKIEDYNITSFDTTKCEFAKVMDIEDYRKWYEFNRDYRNIQLWLQPDAGGNYHFEISQATTTDLNIRITYKDHRDGDVVTFTDTLTIGAGATRSDDWPVTQQDFDAQYGDIEITSIRVADAKGNYVVNGIVAALDWVYVDKTKFADFEDDIYSVNNTYGINSITSWGSAR